MSPPRLHFEQSGWANWFLQSTGSQRPHHCCHLATNVESINRRQTRAKKCPVKTHNKRTRCADV